MGNVIAEEEEKERGQTSLATLLEQLSEALSIVDAHANGGKAAVDAARTHAEVKQQTRQGTTPVAIYGPCA